MSLKRKVVLATGNTGKVAEMQSQLEELGYQVIPQNDYDFDEAIEDGLSFVENALIKARHACKHSGLPSIADDSGLEVDALKGAPGIYSSRYAKRIEPGLSKDQANNQKLLSELKNSDNRSARFQCVIVYMQHQLDPTPIICQGTWEGLIAEAPKGLNGFGHDPLFYLPDNQCHAAELESGVKKNVSHRAQALAQLKEILTLTKRNEHI